MPKFRLLSLVVFGLAFALGIASCSQDTQGGESGALSLQLTIADDVEIDEVAWVIKGGDMPSMGGTIDTSAPGATASIEVFGLPPSIGKDYTITMEAVATDDKTTCKGSEDFGIDVGNVTTIMVMLNCKRPTRLGAVRVNGEFNICAQLTKVVVSPLEIGVGYDIDVSAIAKDEEGDDIEYRWSNDLGAFGDPTARETTYTCGEVGTHDITITITDDGEPCEDSWTVPVECVDVDGVDCTDDVECDDQNDCTQDLCTAGSCLNPDEDPGATCDQDGGAVCDGDGNCVACVENEDCGLDEVCVANTTCVGDPDLFCNENLCETDEAARAACIDRFVTCVAAEPANEEECIVLALLECNECNEDSDCDAGEVCNDNKVCEPTGEIALPMVVDDNYFGRSGFSNGSGGEPLYTEDNDCPERAGEENGQCHRFIWDGMGGDFTGTFWTDGEGFVDLNGLAVEMGATEVSFYAWGAAGGEVITFGAGIGDAELDGAEARRLITLTTAPTLYTVSLAALAGYTDVYGPFIWAADTGGNPSGFEFYVDDIQWIQGGGGGPACSDVIDFEDACGPYVFSDFGGGVATVIDNPDSSGINTTAKVAQMQKFAGEIYGGSTLALDSVVDWSKGTAFTMKVWASRAVPVLFKLEGLNQERSADQTGSSSWEELCYDFTGTTGGAPANAITFIFDLGTSGDAEGDPDNWTFFFDGIVQTDGCGGGVTGDIAINGGFETGTFNDGSLNASWQQFPNGGIQTITTDNPSAGTYAANLNVPVRGPGAPGVDNLIKNANLEAGNLTPGQSITVTWDMRGSLSGAGGVVFVELFSEFSGGGATNEIYTGGPIFPAADWESFTWDTTLGADVSGGVTLQLKAACGAVEGCGADVYFDNVTITVP